MTHPSDPRSAPAGLAEAQANLRAWCAAHPQATFYDMEVETERQLARVRAALVGEAVASTGAVAHPEVTERPACPACGAPMQQVGQQARSVLLPHDATVMIEGPRYRCPACGAGLFPPR